MSHKDIFDEDAMAVLTSTVDKLYGLAQSAVVAAMPLMDELSNGALALPDSRVLSMERKAVGPRGFGHFVNGRPAGSGYRGDLLFISVRQCETQLGVNTKVQQAK
jgi:hypothetical protein